MWTNDIRRAHRVAHAIDTGMCWINSQNVRDLRTPFGGVKASGIGREGGDYAFDFYCETEIVHVALGKAKAAAMFRRPTKAFEDGIAKGRVALLGLNGATPIEGGLPIMVGGKVIGAIGVSGANSDQDAAAATAGLKAAGL